MSICSDIFISREKAEKDVYNKLIFEQERLIKQAIKGMSNSELESHLHSDMYYVTIETATDTIEVIEESNLAKYAKMGGLSDDDIERLSQELLEQVLEDIKATNE